MRLLIVTHVLHHSHGNQIHAYAPYAREIDIWAKLFHHVVIAAPVTPSAPVGSVEPIQATNIHLHSLPSAGGATLRAKLGLVLRLPLILWRLACAMLHADAIQVRCPGNVGFIGAVLAPLFCRRIIAKYAGQWTAYPGEPFSFRCQRRLLSSFWWRGPVLVYGAWPHQPPHVIPFFTSVMTQQQIARARRHCATLQAGAGPLRIIYVGRLTRAKNVHVLLDALAALPIPFTLRIVGDGPERAALQAQAGRSGIASQVQFTGGVPSDQVLDYFQSAEVCVLASESEGWPKALAEAMAFGLLCIGSNRGLVPQLLAEHRGLIVPAGDATALAEALLRVSSEREGLLPVRRHAAGWAQQYSLERLQEALLDLLRHRWSIP